jgi:tRNA nucleotidyltransferase (CCA-adding enzyme)
MLRTANRIKLNDWVVSINQLRVTEHIDNLAILLQLVRQVSNVDAAFGLFLLENDRCLIIGRSATEVMSVRSCAAWAAGGILAPAPP